MEAPFYAFTGPMPPGAAPYQCRGISELTVDYHAPGVARTGEAVVLVDDYLTLVLIWLAPGARLRVRFA